MGRYDSEYYKQNRERIAKVKHKYYLKHKEEIKQQTKKWSQTINGKKYSKTKFKRWISKKRNKEKFNNSMRKLMRKRNKIDSRKFRKR